MIDSLLPLCIIFLSEFSTVESTVENLGPVTNFYIGVAIKDSGNRSVVGIYVLTTRWPSLLE